MANATPTAGPSESVRTVRAEQREWLRKQARAQRELAAAQLRRARAAATRGTRPQP